MFEEACVKYDHISVPFEKMGKFHRTFEEYEKAIPYYEKAIEKGEKNSDYYYFLAECHYNIGRYEDAIGVLQTGADHEGYAGDYFLLMARAYSRQDSMVLAEQALVRGLKSFPDDPGLSQGLQAIRQSMSSTGVGPKGNNRD